MLWTAPPPAFGCHSAIEWLRFIGHMTGEPSEMNASTIGLDIAKNVFQAHAVDTEGEAVTRPSMRFVAIKTPEQQGVLMLHRTRELLVRQRTIDTLTAD